MTKYQFNGRNFTKSLKGYDITEVDTCLQELSNRYNKLLAENNILKTEVEEYREKKEIIQLTLLTAQEMAQKLKIEAEKEAMEIKSSSEKVAHDLIRQAEKEVKSYKDSIYKYLYKCEQDMGLILEDFYALSKKHVNNLELEFMQKVKDKISVMDKNLKANPISKEINKKENSYKKATSKST